MVWAALLGVLGAAVPVSHPQQCTMSTGQAQWVQVAVDGWTRVSREFLRLDAEPFPWTVLIGTSCVWHLEPGPLSGENVVVDVPVRMAGRSLRVVAQVHTGRVQLPSGAVVPAAPTAFAAAYDPAPNTQAPFFVLALPEVWRQDPKAAADPRLEAIILGVLSHEVMHTRQIVDAGRRVDEIRSRHPQLPREVDDDLIERRFREVPGFADAIEAETAMFYRAAAAADPATRLALARAAVQLVDARHSKYFIGADAGFAEIEGLFLNMEGVAVWAAYRLSRVEPRFEIGIKDPEVRERNSWSQDAGLGLVLLIDKLVPDWRARMLTPAMTSPIVILRAALAAPTGRNVRLP